ncbi:esterase/lipase family protein [Leptospira wolffii]|uniref:esterase/lipase family protein n=1 Tax=Leptospira wolffii TaxID=409998 RepID=UPI0002FDA9A5|nr:alpha/beta fold hydrolase [Leptospira wolffii]EPG66573.1 alpha/beta hydrolase family protein [Leptospira wolffii serovar Khorat str. Khorat-H2]
MLALSKKIILLLAASLLIQCATYSAASYARYEQIRAKTSNAVTSRHLSLLTVRFLKSNDLYEKYLESPEMVIYDLDNRFIALRTRELAYYLSELCYHTGSELDGEDPMFARLFASSLVYSYSYLFDKKALPAPDPFSMEFRFALETYNRSLAQLVRHAKKNRKLANLTDLSLPLIRGTLTMVRADVETSWTPKNFLQVEVAYDYKTEGFDNQINKYGIGTPLILIRKESEKEPPERKKYEFVAGVGQAYPGTAFLSLEDSYLENRNLNLNATIHLYDPVHRDRIQFAGMDLPMESDTTTPLAYMLSNAEERDGFFAKFDGEAGLERKGLYLIYPYKKNKIPVVFVHGLASSPFIWFPMINELLADPKIKDKYQFWVYWYPTGTPMPLSAADLRDTLKDLRNVYDPKKEDKAFERMVIVGHSMGGLLAKLMVTRTSREDWLRSVNIPLSKYESLSPDLREEFDRIIQFQPLPFVKRVVFIATPHKGSNLAEGILGSIARILFVLPKGLATNVAKAYKALIPDGKDDLNLRESYGLDGLSPNSYFMKVTGHLKPEVKFHSIIGNSKFRDLEWINDSVVPYDSSHLDGAESELLVESDHSVQEHMPTILEIKRILLEHISQSGN